MLQMYQFQEDYDLALIGFARAIALDPTFPEAIEKQQALVKYLSTVSDLVEAKVSYLRHLLSSIAAILQVQVVSNSVELRSIKVRGLI